MVFGGQIPLDGTRLGHSTKRNSNHDSLWKRCGIAVSSIVPNKANLWRFWPENGGRAEEQSQSTAISRHEGPEADEREYAKQTQFSEGREVGKVLLNKQLRAVWLGVGPGRQSQFPWRERELTRRTRATILQVCFVEARTSVRRHRRYRGRCESSFARTQRRGASEDWDS
jgi:hypothetical protein